MTYLYDADKKRKKEIKKKKKTLVPPRSFPACSWENRGRKEQTRDDLMCALCYGSPSLQTVDKGKKETLFFRIRWPYQHHPENSKQKQVKKEGQKVNICTLPLVYLLYIDRKKKERKEKRKCSPVYAPPYWFISNTLMRKIKKIRKE